MVAIFSVSAGLIGVCLTGIGLLRVVMSVGKITTLGDELLALDSLLFLATCVVAFISFRTRDARRRQLLRRVADATFLLGLGLMAAVAALITYAVI